jgi:hypothetical protein
MRRFRFVGVRFVLFGIAALAIAGLVTSALWNALIPAILHLPAISFWQAIGLLVLSRILFGRWGGAARRMRKARCVRGWGDLTPSERERFRQAMGHHGAPEEI